MCFLPSPGRSSGSCWSAGFAENWKAAPGRLRLTADRNGILQDERGKAKGFWKSIVSLGSWWPPWKQGFCVCVFVVHMLNTLWFERQRNILKWRLLSILKKCTLCSLQCSSLAVICFSSDFCNMNTFVKPPTHFMLSSIIKCPNLTSYSVVKSWKLFL